MKKVANANSATKYLQKRLDTKPSEVINQLNICYRVCKKCSRNLTKDGPGAVCSCGRNKNQHGNRNERSEWSMESHTYAKIGAHHGQLQNGAYFIRLALDTPLSKTEQILSRAWGIPQPRLIISIIGGAKYFKLNDQLETNFINGVVDVALRSDACIFTSGYNVGIVKLVGQAVQKTKLTEPNKTITAIGVCKWGCIKDVENITMPSHMRAQQTVNDAARMETRRETSTKRVKGEHELEMNHSHYLMLDDGSARQYDIGDYRTQLIAHWAGLRSDNRAFALTLVVEGGEDTINNMYYDLRSDIPIIIINESGRAANFFNYWLSYTANVRNDDRLKNTIIDIYEFSAADEGSSGNKGSSSQHQNGASNSSYHSPVTKKHVTARRRQLDEIFGKYREQIRKDLSTKVLHDTRTRNNEQKRHNDSKENEKLDDLIAKVMYCLQPAVRDKITIYNLSSNVSLSDEILRSISKSREKCLKQQKSDKIHGERLTSPDDKKLDALRFHEDYYRHEQNVERSRILALAMDWDCIDIAKEFIFQNSLDNVLNSKKVFRDALTKKLPTFVHELLRLGVDPSEVFSTRKADQRPFQYQEFIRTLYNVEAVNDPSTHFKEFISGNKDDNEKRINNVDALNEALHKLVGNYMYPLYFDSIKDENRNRIQNGLEIDAEEDPTRGGLVKNNQKSVAQTHPGYSTNMEEEEEKQRDYDYILRDLFLWAIFMNQVDMAKVFLAHMKHRICPALIATKIFKEYDSQAIYGEVKQSYQTSAKYFENYAVESICHCYEEDQETACQIVLQQNKLYGYVTCLQVAADARDQDFIATACCVRAMNDIWFDKLDPDQSNIFGADRSSGAHLLRLAIGYFTFGLAAPLVCHYRKNESGKKQDSEPTLRPNGINYCDVSLSETEDQHLSKPLLHIYASRLKNFHTSLPIKFLHHIISYLFFLLLFSYVLLFKFSPPSSAIPSIDWTEILLIILVSFMLIEEIHYFSKDESVSIYGKLKNYFSELFKIMTFIGFLLFYIGLIVRFRVASSETDFVAARVIMAYDLELWWLRCLSFIIVGKPLGPHLVAIGKMLKDLLFFLVIIAIVMTAYGVASRSMVYYPEVNGFTTATGGNIDASFDGRSVFRQIAYPVYYLLFGQMDNELQNLDNQNSAAWSIATHVILAIHMMFVNVLLFNLLIAMFSQRYSEVHEVAKNIWYSQQHKYVREYYFRSPFMPPISVIFDIYYICRILYFSIRSSIMEKAADYNKIVFKMIPKDNSLINDLVEFEGASTFEYAHEQLKTTKIESKKENIKSDDDTISDDTKSAYVVENLQKLKDTIGTLDKTVKELLSIKESPVTDSRTINRKK